MRKLILIGFVILTAATMAIGQEIFAYWIVGNVADAADGTKADGRKVLLYHDEAARQHGQYAEGTILNNKFILNAFNIWPMQLKFGETYYVATALSADGYGAIETVTISGIGWDQVKDMTLAAGVGIVEAAPIISQVKIGGRVYFKHLVERKEDPIPFVTSPVPNIEVKVEGRQDHGIDAASFKIIRDEGLATAHTYTIPPTNFKTQAAPTGVVNSMSVAFDIPESAPLAKDVTEEENHTLTFKVASMGLRGAAAATEEVVRLTLAGGPLRLIGQPLVHPVPFSRTKHGKVEIQYTLSSDANLEIYLMSAGGEIIKRWTVFAGSENGQAGTNKLSWNGITDAGYAAGNGVYVGTIVSRDDNRLLGKFKLTILD